MGTSNCNTPPIAVDLAQHSTLVLLCCFWIGLAALPTPSQTPPSQPTPRQPTPSSPNLRPVLKLGSQGNEVAELQAMLKLLGFYTEAVNGIYQESTANAVAAFQQAAGIQPDGIVGAETWNRLLPTANPASATAPTPNPGSPIPANSTSPTPTPTITPAPQPSTTIPNYTPVTPTPAPTTPSATSPVEFPILRVGMNGDAVIQLQERLKAIGLFSGAVDGVFGPETESAVQAAQRNYNLEPDGIVGPATWKALFPGS